MTCWLKYLINQSHGTNLMSLWCLLMVKQTFRMGDERALKWIWTWLEFCETAGLYGFSCTVITMVYREGAEKEKISCDWQFSWSKRKEPNWFEMVEGNTKLNNHLFFTKLCRIPSLNALKTRIHLMPLLSIKNRKLSWQFACDHHN